MPKTHRVRFQPFGREVRVPDGQTILDAARAAGIEMNAPCGGKGTCGGCRVEITRGTPPASGPAVQRLTAEELQRNLRLACQVRVTCDMTVVIPAETLLFDQQILESGLDVDVTPEPNVRREHLQLSEPGVGDQRSDLDRVLDVLAERGMKPAADITMLRELPGALRGCAFDGTAIVLDDHLAAFEPGDTMSRQFGVAVDVGTTTVVASLMDLTTGRQAAVASAANPQASRGDDVVSRIEYCLADATHLQEMQALIVGCLNDLVRRLCGSVGLRPTDIFEMTVVGNTTMTHLLLRLPVDNIGRAPFIAALRQGLSTSARELGLAIHDRGRAYVGPSIAGFVGADTVAVILATRLHESDRLRMVIDIGTNGELVLGNRERLLACSTAAGPAFEGARIRYGMRAAAGAIDRVDIADGTLRVHTIGDAPAVGLCGTGLIEAVSACLETGIVNPMGLMQAADEVPGLSADLASRLVATNGETAFCLSSAEQCGAGHPVLLTQRDVREVQLAKGAIFAGAAVLMAEMGVTADDLDEVLLAGAFGNYIRPERARSVGLLPRVPLERVRFVGNAAGTGAKMLLVNRSLRQTVEQISCNVRHVELSGRADFQNLFAEAMLFES
ncbi:MAG: DUF4445 domain-containing protein [Planctomycetes bacterium]|nr:DUF4445 domain-containing protein [Planctomycetota bacterium]